MHQVHAYVGRRLGAAVAPMRVAISIQFLCAAQLAFAFGPVGRRSHFRHRPT